eukprot:1185341-Prorocentrum_minimum.AAC.2
MSCRFRYPDSCSVTAVPPAAEPTSGVTAITHSCNPQGGWSRRNRVSPDAKSRRIKRCQKSANQTSARVRRGSFVGPQGPLVPARGPGRDAQAAMAGETRLYYIAAARYARRHAPAARAARPRPRLAGRIRPPRPAVGPLPP